MTSKERHELRYIRRKRKRLLKRIENSNKIGTLSDVISYHKMFYYGKKCCNGVRWKNSTQRFELHLFSGTATRVRDILNKSYKWRSYTHFIISERGKIRPIDAPHIADRQAQKVFTNEVLCKLYSPSMIYDNGASQKGKGLHFSFRRFKKHLRDHVRKNGLVGAVVFIDIEKFFPNAPRWYVKLRHKQFMFNKDIREFADSIIDSFSGDTGMLLGVEPSQLEMVSLTSKVDNYVKCQLGYKGFAHYADDYYCIVNSLQEGKDLLKVISDKMFDIGLKVNINKCCIIPINKYYKYCKAKFSVNELCKVTSHGCRDGMKRSRRKLKLFKNQYDNNLRDKKSVKEWLMTQTAYYNNYNDHYRVLKLNRMYYSMFESK